MVPSGNCTGTGDAYATADAAGACVVFFLAKSLMAEKYSGVSFPYTRAKKAASESSLGAFGFSASTLPPRVTNRPPSPRTIGVSSFCRDAMYCNGVICPRRMASNISCSFGSTCG